VREHMEINTSLIAEIKQLIEQSRQKVAIAVYSEISMLYWHIGKRINSDILNNKRAEYGKQIIATLSQQLTREYGRGWSAKQLHHCLYTVEIFHDLMILPPKELLKEKLQLAIEIAKNKLPDNE